MKIRIFGGIASGKSTLAKELGKEFKLPIFCTDDFVFTKNFGKRRPNPERIKIIKNKLKKNWIVEGVHYAKWVKETYEKADFIIILDIPKIILFRRIISRTYREEKKHYKNKFLDSLRLIWIMLRDTSKEIKEYIKIAKKYKKKCLILKDNDWRKCEKWLMN